MHLTAYTNRLEQVDQTLVLPLADLADSPEYGDHRLIHSRSQDCRAAWGSDTAGRTGADEQPVLYR